MKTFATAVLAAIGLAFNTMAIAHGMSKTEYEAAKGDIEAGYESAMAACEPLLANAKDICLARAKGNEHVAMADLRARYKPGSRARYDARIAKADAEHSVAMEKCDEKAANDRDACAKEADALRTAARADAKARRRAAGAHRAARHESAKARERADKTIAEERRQATAAGNDADYAAAVDKCGALSGDAASLCVSDAKAHYGKS